MQPEPAEVNLFELDWSNISPKAREEILSEHVHCVNLARKAVNAEGAYIANLRSLIVMLTVSMAMAIYGAENRTIALTLVSMQFIKTLVSRLFSFFDAHDSIIFEFFKYPMFPMAFNE